MTRRQETATQPQEALVTDSTITALCSALMRAVVASGAVRSEDAELACRVMREETKRFVLPPETGEDSYAAERELILSGGNQRLALASLAATCVQRILAERA